jgi:adenosylcobinamide-GDP ribazoletransferase
VTTTISRSGVRGGAGQAVAFLTVFGRGAVPTPASLAWFPLVGAAIGSVLGLVWWGLSQVFPPGVAAVIVVAADVGVTGMLHFDGLLDAADGLLPHLSPERRLEVMSEPGVGAFAVVIALVVVIARVVALSSISPVSWWKAVLLLGALWVVSRSAMVVATARMRYVREGGIAAAFLSGEAKAGPALGTALFGIGAAGAALVAWHVVAGLPVVAAALVGASAVLLLAQRRLGGYTGDVLGAAGVIGETLGLLVAAAKW